MTPVPALESWRPEAPHVGPVILKSAHSANNANSASRACVH